MKPQTRLQKLYRGETHGAYTALRLAKEGIMPTENPKAKQALDAIENAIFDHFGELNALQQIQLALMRPLFIFFIIHPGLNPEGDKRINHDFQWIHNKVEVGLKNLITLGESAGKKAEEFDISRYLVNVSKAKNEETSKDKSKRHTERRKPSWSFRN